MIQIQLKSKTISAVLDYVKRNWKELLIVVLLSFFYIKGKMDYNSLFKMHQETVAGFETRIQELNEAHEERLREKDEAIEQYIQRVENIRNQYDTEKEEINIRRETEKEEIKQILLEKPEELISNIESRFGFEYVE
tara:strand:+ start:653 stop:1060 length:408 start_codon:yes stop_codon:yes gene_type:complete